MAQQQVPSVGRVVHFTWNGRCNAAIITNVYTTSEGEPTDVVSLTVFEPGLSPFMTTAGRASGEGNWHWPEYVPAAEVADTQQGDLIMNGNDGGHWRQFLEGKALHAGDRIEWLHLGQWVVGRYETSVWQRQGFFYPSHTGMGVYKIDTSQDRFRWPAKQG